MAVRRIGNLADFAKYGLTKRLAGNDFRVGVVWYPSTEMTPRVNYLSRAEPNEYSDCDAALYRALRGIHRTAAPVSYDKALAAVLPIGTVFHTKGLATDALHWSLRADARAVWFEEALSTSESAELVLLDANRGLLPPSKEAFEKGGNRYVTVEEVLAFLARGQSVVLVQFGRPRNYEREPKVARKALEQLATALRENRHPKPFGLWWAHFVRIGLLVAPTPDHEPKLRLRANDILTDRAWSKKVVLL
jgi:hypothetical protein